MAIMAAATQLVLLLLVFLLAPSTTMASSSRHGSHGSHTTKHSPSPRPSPAPPSVLPIPIMTPPAALVRATCNSTTYPSICVSALAADPSSATADLRGLSAIAVAAAASNASASATALGVGANGTTGTAQGGGAGDAQAMVMRTCAGMYGEARDALAAARGSIEQRDYDYAAVHVSAAAEYPRVCRALFFRARRQRSASSPAPAAAYPAELAAREAALGQLCSVALDIIALLNTTTTN